MKILCCGAGGFIGSHLVTRLVNEGHEVYGADLKYPEWSESPAEHFDIVDLRHYDQARHVMRHRPDLIFQLAADMGGAGYVFTGTHDAEIMKNSAQININMAQMALQYKATIVYTSSACIYPAYNQTDPENPNCAEDSAYPAEPDSEYGWEKLFSERLYSSYHRCYGLDIRIARLHNIFGPEGTYDGGKEKAPAAMCRKVALADDRIDVWGDGNQTRSFLYIDECVEGLIRLWRSDCTEPVNLGSEEMVTINELAKMAISISGKDLKIHNLPSKVLGVMGRNSDNRLIFEKLGWKPDYPLRKGMEQTYQWVSEQVKVVV